MATTISWINSEASDADARAAEQAAAPTLGDQFDEPFRGAADHRFAVVGKGVLLGHKVEPLGFAFVLGQSDRGDFWMRKNGEKF